MKEREVCSELKIKHFVITEATPHSNLSEKEIIVHLQSQGYKVYKNYSFYFRERMWDDINKKYYYPDSSRLQKKTLLKIKPQFPESIYELFNKHANGEPDVLLEKGGVWKFVEIKTSTDSIRYNQLIFLEELSQLWDTSVHFYTNLSGVPTVNPKKLLGHPDRRVVKSNKEIAFTSKVIELVNNQKKHNFKPFWAVIESFLDSPVEVYNSVTYRFIISENTGIPMDKINWFVKNQCQKIAKEESDKIYKENIITKETVDWFPKYKELIEVAYGKGKLDKHLQ